MAITNLQLFHKIFNKIRHRVIATGRHIDHGINLLFVFLTRPGALGVSEIDKRPCSDEVSVKLRVFFWIKLLFEC